MKIILQTNPTLCSKLGEPDIRETFFYVIDYKLFHLLAVAFLILLKINFNNGFLSLLLQIFYISDSLTSFPREFL